MENSAIEPFLILASQSPRRRELLAQAGLTFTVIPSTFDENSVPISTPQSYVQTLARAKAETVAAEYPAGWVIGADTVVVIDAIILGKPASRAEAKSMLRRLSGREHEVLTGYAIGCSQNRQWYSEVITTRVRFKPLSEAEIGWYTQTTEPFDKAGAYAIQGLGMFLVKSINGSYTNVVGLPVCEVLEHLARLEVLDRARGADT